MAVIGGKYGTTGEERPLQLGIFESGVTELVGINEQVDQNDYGAHVAVNLHGSGEILGAHFVSSGGDVLQVAGDLLIFNAAVTVAAGDTSITLAERRELCGIISISASDWQADANGASQYIYSQPVAYNTNDLYLVFFLTSATSINSAAEDDEILEVNLFYRLDHR
ncbi:MAG: hypothetical protein P8124_14095, partial [Gammaproteobacteria bacterium]